MAEPSLDHSVSTAKYSLHDSEKLRDKLSKSAALIEVMLLSPECLSLCHISIIERFLMVLGELICDSLELFNDIWTSLQRAGIKDIEDLVKQPKRC
jgi:uncharacterized protein YuzB (UPF0349 family)